MSLTPEQQRVAEQAMALIPACLKSFWKSFPCLRSVAACCDLEGAAHLAITRAAKTYDPGRGVGISAYFSVAIRNLMLQEVQREIRSQAHSIRRIPLEEVYRRQPPKREQADEALPALLELTEEERDWIEQYVFEGASFRSFGRQSGRDPRTAKKILMGHLDKLRSAVEDQP
jgi:DNA-directed RNA polymerase specialized sigma24 family protein